MKAKTIKGKSLEEIKSSLQESMKDGFNPTLSFVFTSFKQNIDEIIRTFNNYNIAIYGTTTNGEINDEEIMEGAISILLLDLAPSHFKVFFEDLDYKSPDETSKKYFKVGWC